MERGTDQSILLDNVQQLANFILNKKKESNFNIPTIVIERNDSLDIQQGFLQ